MPNIAVLFTRRVLLLPKPSSPGIGISHGRRKASSVPRGVPLLCVGALSVASLASCGGADSPRDTCFRLVIHYAGSRAGTGYARLRGDNGVTAVGSSYSAPSIEEVGRIYSGLVFCSTHAVNPGDLPVVADAWIDVTGTESAICADVMSVTCEPLATDPQGHTDAVLPFGRMTTVTVNVVDP